MKINLANFSQSFGNTISRGWSLIMEMHTHLTNGKQCKKGIASVIIHRGGGELVVCAVRFLSLESVIECLLRWHPDAFLLKNSGAPGRNASIFEENHEVLQKMPNNLLRQTINFFFVFSSERKKIVLFIVIILLFINLFFQSEVN